MKPEIATYLSSLTTKQSELVLAMREAVLAAGDSVQEGIKWGSIAFYNNKNICGYRVAKNHVTLLFMEGAQLQDPNKVLSGSGAKARTIKATSVDEIPLQDITAFVKQSLALGM